MSRILLLHGPNLNLLGTREPDIYGADTLDDINARARQYAEARGHAVDAFQSNAEHDLVDAVQRAKRDGVEFIVVNPAAFTHTSVALRDALLAVDIPFIEVHLSNVHAREDFRQRSYFSDIARGVISGLGAFGYDCAVRAAVVMLDAE
ncbi:MAG: type II 3-dehydroquinate dehydratase [Gammaproteobacteria bacterium]|nr:type II 3-dehydroquinate dehydratase [Gammaproteobacteria bacterium]MDE0224835.1 type II 3-dehydroquinate dehydratase [Gammaproteobacteria bacterium]MDE0451508.1 type II 3-dehydroquinate dehydratase [Gammaproteobacteria bacterium]